MIIKDVLASNFEEDNFKKQMHIKTSDSLRLGVFLAIVGGFLDAYTYICRGQVFANAQTGNIVLVGVELTKGDFKQASMAFLQILAFILGVIVSEKIKNIEPPSIVFVKNVECVILIIEIFVLFIIGFIPSNVPQIFTTIPISFVSSVQISSFRTLVDSPYSTTMCTGNLRSACHAAYIAVTKKDRTCATKTIRYATIIFSFLIGTCICGISTLFMGYKSIWISAIILGLCVCMFIIDDYKFIDHNSN